MPLKMLRHHLWHTKNPNLCQSHLEFQPILKFFSVCGESLSEATFLWFLIKFIMAKSVSEGFFNEWIQKCVVRKFLSLWNIKTLLEQQKLNFFEECHLSCNLLETLLSHFVLVKSSFLMNACKKIVKRTRKTFNLANNIWNKF